MSKSKYFYVIEPDSSYFKWVARIYTPAQVNKGQPLNKFVYAELCLATTKWGIKWQIRKKIRNLEWAAKQSNTSGWV